MRLPRVCSACCDDIAAIPRPITTPRVSTTSIVAPTSKFPVTCTTPAGNNDVPFEITASRAPSSITTEPEISEAKAIHNFREDNCRSWGRNLVPTSLPVTAANTASLRCADAITAVTPDHDAIRAAASFDAIPPLPRAVPAPVVVTANNGSSACTTRTMVASGLPRGSAV